MQDRTRGIMQLIASAVFMLFALLKVLGQPYNELLYTSRVTVALYLFISLVLALSAILLYLKNKYFSNYKR